MSETTLLPSATASPLILNEGWRITENALQWMLQRRDPGADRWRDVAFCRSRAGLVRCIREYVKGDIDTAVMAEVSALPRWHR